MEPAVAEQARKHVDVIKFWTDDNLGKAKRMPFDIGKAIIDSAHRHGVRVVAHVYYLEDAKKLSGLRHRWAGAHRARPAGRPGIDRSMKRHNTWQIASTLSREVSLFVYAKTPDFVSDPFFTRGVSADVDQDSEQSRIPAEGCRRIRISRSTARRSRSARRI